MKATFSLSLLSLAAVLPAVFAHGRVESITIKGKKFEGPRTGDTKTPSVIRAVNSIEPRQDVTDDDMSCGAGAANVKAQLSADVNAGDEILFDWVNGGQTHPWPHKLGPIINYMADCGGDCSEFDSLKAKWFKVDEAGINPKTGRWFQEDTIFVGKTIGMKVPDDLPSGNYLIRHEVIALHNAGSAKGAEFYPSCAQVKVTGKNQGTASSDLPSSDFVSFPGAYSAKDPGILVDVFPLKGAYQFPGPDVANFEAGGVSGGPGGNGNDNTKGNGEEDAAGNSSASRSSTVSRPTSTSSTSISTITPLPANNDNGNGNDGAGDEDVETVTVTETITANPRRATKTVTVTATVSDVAAAAVDTVTVSVTPSASANAEGPYRRRSRIMGRRHY